MPSNARRVAVTVRLQGHHVPFAGAPWQTHTVTPHGARDPPQTSYGSPARHPRLVRKIDGVAPAGSYDRPARLTGPHRKPYTVGPPTSYGDRVKVPRLEDVNVDAGGQRWAHKTRMV